ncbi:hypothetical protein L204_101250 [Cryptococcus depauperatus]
MCASPRAGGGVCAGRWVSVRMVSPSGAMISGATISGATFTHVCGPVCKASWVAQRGTVCQDTQLVYPVLMAWKVWARLKGAARWIPCSVVPERKRAFGFWSGLFSCVGCGTANLLALLWGSTRDGAGRVGGGVGCRYSTPDQEKMAGAASVNGSVAVSPLSLAAACGRGGWAFKGVQVWC